MTELSDANLVEKILNGDSPSGNFRMLVERHQKYFLAVARKILLNQDDALDVLQDAMLKAYRRLGTIKDAAAFRSWATRIIVNLSRNKVTRTRTFYEVVAEPEAGRKGDSEGAADRAEMAESIEVALAKLPEVMREVVVLCLMEDLNSTEAAGILGIPAATVRWRLHQAREKLKPMLKDWL